MVSTTDLLDISNSNNNVGLGIRLLEVDVRLALPVGLPIRVIVTSNDVLHS
jgi:heme/copper-type cytochrome/quinol oxidase subunit 2